MEKRIFNLFKDFEIYLVGGAVRDRILGRHSNDLDFATNAVPEQTKAILENAGFHTHDVGWSYGTVGIFYEGFEIHITTYRKNESYKRNSRQPQVSWGSTLTEDLCRRDFTINALALDSQGKIIDLFNGVQHLDEKIIETPIIAEEAFRDDPLRILRAVRFKSRLDFHYSPGVKRALHTQAHRLLILPRERIQEELNKILLGDSVEKALSDLYHYKHINYFLPELTILGATEQQSIYHHKNVWLHTTAVVANTPKNIQLRYAALFHDIGKPYVRTIDTGYHFYRHEEVSAFMAKSILNRLGLPKKWINEIVFLIRNHMRPNLYDGSWSDSAIRRFVADMGPALDNVLALSQADITSHRDNIVEEKLNQFKELKERVETLSSFKEVKSPLNGKDLMKAFGLKEGREIGRLKNILINALIEGDIDANQFTQFYVDYIKNMGKE